MRAVHHIQDIHKLITILGSFDEIEFTTQYESAFMLICNISASQLREALKLFDKLTKTDFYSSIYKLLQKNEKNTVDSLIVIVDEYKTKQGFLVETLKPLRDTTFHYLNDIQEIITYIQETKKSELQREPDYQTINLESFNFGPGRDYDSIIYHDYLAYGKTKISPLKAQVKVWELQDTFIDVTQMMIQQLMKRENIEKRSIKEMTDKYWHGYKE